MSDYEKDRRRIAYGFALAIVLIVGYLTVENPELLNPVVVGIISLFLVSTLALLGVENPIQRREGEGRDKFLERLAKGGDDRNEDVGPQGRREGEAHPRSDRRQFRRVRHDHISDSYAW